MAKKNASKGKCQQNRGPRMSSIDLPEILTIDQLAELADEELVAHLRELRSALDKVRKERCNAQAWEVELCYAERELTIRKDRREAHRSYLKSIGELSTKEVREENLPSADLDNSSFTALMMD